LEALTAGVPVIGFRKGGLQDFITPEGALDENNPSESFFCSMEMLPSQVPVSLESFSHANWTHRLDQLFRGANRVLLVHDYMDAIGGAEIYVAELEHELRKMGKTVSRVGAV